MNKFEFASKPIHQLPGNYSSQPDVRIVTPELNFGAGGACREINSIYEDIARNDVVWQPDVYAEARIIAERNNIRHIIDVGCGNGEKLIHFFPSEMFVTIGLDFGGSLKLANEQFPKAHWAECNFNSHHDLTRVFKDLDLTEPTLIIFSDVIEHLTDPRIVLAHLRMELMRNVENRLILSTPDREILNYQKYGEPSENMAHVREWTIAELTQFCESSGFQIARRGYTRSNQFDQKYSTIFMELRCDPSAYLRFLKSEGLLYGNVFPDHLMVTSEYAGLHSTGGIGTFVAEQRQTYVLEKTLCLFTGMHVAEDTKAIRRLQLVIPEYLIDKSVMNLPNEEIILQAVQQVLFYLPNIKKLEYADYQGLCFRLTQAKCAGLFPPKLQLIVHCHGVTHYLENANETWFGKTHLNVAEREKISVENADRAVFPTAFLRNLYLESGIELSEDKIVNLRYPYHFAPIKIKQTSALDTIIFYGKRSAMKGYDIFLRTLEFNDRRPCNYGIKRIIFIGPRIKDTADDRERIDKLREHYDVVEFTSLGRDEVVDMLHEYASNAICVMPYLGDNHPYAMLDVTFAGMLPLMLRAGGVVELFPNPFDEILLADPTEESLLEYIVRLVTLPVAERHRLCVNFLKAMISAQQIINDDYCNFGKEYKCDDVVLSEAQATVIVPVYNTKIQYIHDLVFGLNNQTLRPAEVIFIDDASEPGYLATLKEHLKDQLRIPYRVIHHNKNKGLAGARNSGLAATNTEIIINIDSDDVPMNEFVQDIVYRLNSQPNCDAAVPYIKPFNEGTDFNKKVKGAVVYKPIGEGVVAALLDNILGHANSGYRVSTLRSLGGWDESDKSMWEDWALLIKLTSTGHRIGMIPKVGCLYRVRKNSMLRTYKKWPAMRRLARNVEALPRFDAFRLQSLMRHSKEESETLQIDINRLRTENQTLISRLESLNSEKSNIQAEIERCRTDNMNLNQEIERYRVDNIELNTQLDRLNNVIHSLSAELNRASVRAIRRIVAILARFPRLYAFSRAIASIVWRLAKWLRNGFTRGPS